METKKKVILFCSIGLGLVGLGIFGYKKGWLSKKNTNGEKKLNTFENLIAGAKKEDTEENNEKTDVKMAGTKTTPTYQAVGENNGLDLYHKMVSMCAECYDNKGNQKETDYLIEYFKKSGAKGNTYSGGCYRAIQELYKDDPYFDEAMSLIGSKEQFRRDINQYRKESTFRI